MGQYRNFEWFHFKLAIAMPNPESAFRGMA